MDFVKQNLKMIGFVGCALMIIGNFLPFVTASFLGLSESQTLMSGENTILGIVAIIFEVAMAILINTGKKKKLVLVPTIIIILFLAICYSYYSDYSSLVSFGSGFYCIVIGCILEFVYAFVKSEPKQVTTKNE